MQHTSATSTLIEGRCVAARVRRLHRVVVRLYDDALRRHGITVAQLDLLVTLLEQGGSARPADLGRWLRMDRSTVSRNVGRLERLGLVTTGPGDRGGQRRIAVSAEGRRLTTEATPAWAGAQEQALALLGPDGLGALDLLVDRLNPTDGGDRT